MEEGEADKDSEAPADSAAEDEDEADDLPAEGRPKAGVARMGSSPSLVGPQHVCFAMLCPEQGCCLRS